MMKGLQEYYRNFISIKRDFANQVDILVNGKREKTRVGNKIQL